MIGIKPFAWITVIILIAATLTLILHLSTNNEEFSRNNIGLNGTSDFFSTLDRHTTTNIRYPSDLDRYQNATLLIIAPARDLTSAEAAYYRDFVTRGNTLLLADEFGTGNSLLSTLEGSIVIRPGILSSVDRAYGDAYKVVVNPVGQSRFFLSDSSILLDKAATLTGGDPILKSSVFSWVDQIPDRELSKGEILDRYTVMAQERKGNGLVYVISDTSIFINAMRDPGGSLANRLFLAEIARTPGPLLVDTYISRTAQEDGLGEILNLARSNSEYKIVIAALLMFGVVFSWRKRLI